MWTSTQTIVDQAFSRDVEDVLAAFDVDLQNGLTSAQIEKVVWDSWCVCSSVWRSSVDSLTLRRLRMSCTQAREAYGTNVLPPEAGKLLVRGAAALCACVTLKFVRQAAAICGRWFPQGPPSGGSFSNSLTTTLSRSSSSRLWPISL